jgi:hypothetical protein
VEIQEQGNEGLNRTGTQITVYCGRHVEKVNLGATRNKEGTQTNPGAGY